MTTNLFLKAGIIWLLIAVCAIGNGAIRESVLAPHIGQNLALPASGISLSVIVFIVTYSSFQFFGKNDSQTYLLIGLQWLFMALIFEFVLGHYVFGKSWSDIFQLFNIMKGDLFILVLLTSLFSPLLVAKIKGVQ